MTKKKEETPNAPAEAQGSAIMAPTEHRRGFEEGYDQDSLEIPRAKLMQGLSPEVLENPETFRIGMIINSVTLDILPEVFIPLFKFTEWIRFNPKDNRAENFDPNYPAGKLIWRSKDPNDPRVIEEGAWGPDGQKPLATKFMNFFSIFEGEVMPVVVSFCNTSFKTGKRLYTMTTFTPGGGDMWAHKYRLGKRTETNDKGTYNVFTVAPAGKSSPEEMAMAEEYYNLFKGRDIQVHQEEEPVEAV